MALLTVAVTSRAADVVWYDGASAVSYVVEGKASTVVDVALEMFSSDMRLVTGQPAVASKNGTIRICQLDKASTKTVKALRSMGVPTDSLRGRFDAFYLGQAGGRILVVGSNGRGTAYGLLELSRKAGVSPWVWWGDVRPSSRNRLVLRDDDATFQSPSVQYRGIFINDEDWSLRRWSSETFEPTGKVGIGPKTYKEIFKLLLRLRANTLWPAMHEGGTGFFTVEGNKLTADSCGILIGTSHCEPLLRNNVAEWDKKVRGDYNYITNRQQVKEYWAERLKEVKGSEELFTIGMRGIHDGSMEGVKTAEEKLNGLQQVIDDQRELIRKYYDKDVERVPQVFIPYKEVLEIMESGLRVPDDVTLMWCDDNYGYLTRLPDAEQQQRSGGGGIYYHLSYWGRPHDHLWLTTTQPGLIYKEMREAYDHNCRKLWIANVHDPKVAAYQLELFLDMAWDIRSVEATPGTERSLTNHMTRWLCTQFGAEVGKAVAPAMRELCRLNGIRRPEFMGWTQVELDKKKYPGGKSVPSKTEFSRKEAYQRMADFARIEATVDVYGDMVRDHLRDAYFAHVLYPVHAAAAMTRKMLAKPGQSEQAYEQIQQLTKHYNEQMSNGKWRGLMSAAPRNLPVFAKGARTKLPQHPSAGRLIARNACDFDRIIDGDKEQDDKACQAIDLLGHSMKAVALKKGATLEYSFCSPTEGEAVLYVALIPTQPSDRGDLRFEVSIDNGPETVVSLKEPYRSERWKQNVLRGQALRKIPVRLTGEAAENGRHQLRIKALDDHIVVDQWMIDFCKDRQFYVIPAKSEQ